MLIKHVLKELGENQVQLSNPYSVIVSYVNSKAVRDTYSFLQSIFLTNIKLSLFFQKESSIYLSEIAEIASVAWGTVRKSTGNVCESEIQSGTTLIAQQNHRCVRCLP